MHFDDLYQWQHDHTFGQEKRRTGELRTIIVMVLTATTMVVEIGAGIYFGSMALLADGLHMAAHAAALTIAAFAYVYARRHAHDQRYSFGTGKVNALGGFTGAVLLGLFALVMGWESIERLILPVEIAFNHAIVVAILGFAVNGLSVVILGHTAESGRQHAVDSDSQQSGHDDHVHHDHDHNLRAAYFHVLADLLTSLLAIVALLAGKYLGLQWMDPLMGIVGMILVVHWSVGLFETTGAVLLDRQAPQSVQDTIRQSIETHEGIRVVDLHVWSIGPRIYAVELVIVTHEMLPPDHYKELLPKNAGLVHVMVEVHQHCDVEFQKS